MEAYASQHMPDFEHIEGSISQDLLEMAEQLIRIATGGDGYFPNQGDAVGVLEEIARCIDSIALEVNIAIERAHLEVTSE